MAERAAILVHNQISAQGLSRFSAERYHVAKDVTDPVAILVVPRILALIITLPILGVIADFAGLIGGALMAWIELGVSPGMFRGRLLEAVDVWQFLIGIIKAPFFALTIGLIGCYQGLQVEGNAESLGRLTSRSVVLSIFFVIVLDAVFSVFFSILEL